MIVNSDGMRDEDFWGGRARGFTILLFLLTNIYYRRLSPYNYNRVSKVECGGGAVLVP